MKNKAILTLIFSLFLASSCTNFEPEIITGKETSSLEDLTNFKIYDMVNGKLNRVTTAYLKKKWEASLKNEGTEANLNTFEMLTDKDENGIDFYFIKARSEDGTIEIGTFIEMRITKLRPQPEGILGEKTCKCTGTCSSGCSLSISGSGSGKTCTCSPCWPSGTCTKTEEG